jgi:hypothetical protein
MKERRGTEVIGRCYRHRRPHPSIEGSEWGLPRAGQRRAPCRLLGVGQPPPDWLGSSLRPFDCCVEAIRKECERESEIKYNNSASGRRMDALP